MIYRYFSLRGMPLILPTIFIFNVIAQIGYKTPNRELAIILDSQKEESIDKTLSGPSNYRYMAINHPVGIGAITMTALIALNQQASPILLSSSIVENIVKHKKLFFDFMYLNESALAKKYGKYPRFRDAYNRSKFEENANYIKKVYPAINKEIAKKIKNNDPKHVVKELSQIAADPKFNVKNAPNGLNHLINSDVNRAMYCEMIMYTLCYNTPIGNDKWFIKKVSKDFYLFIPKIYLTKNFKNLDLSKINQYEKNKSLTALEFNLGLKVNHLKNIDIDDFEAEANPVQILKGVCSADKKINKAVNKSFVHCLSKLFVLNSDFKNTEGPIWSIYFTGHGFPISPVIASSIQLEKLRASYAEQLKEPVYKNCLGARHADLANQNKVPSHSAVGRVHQNRKHIVNCKVHNEFRKINEKLKKIDRELAKLKEQKKYLLPVHWGIIASLSLEEFQNALLFFNNNINTAFLFYTSCFAGGEHLIIPYTKNNQGSNPQPLIFNYPIVSGTLAENMSLQEMPLIKLPPYDVITNNGAKVVNGIIASDIDFKKKCLKLITTLQFKKFFKALRNKLHYQNNNLPKLICNLHPYTNSEGKILYECLANVPHVRLPGHDKFQIIPDDKAFLTITPEFVQTRKTNAAINLNSEPTLLYADYIPQRITLNTNNKYMPPCISMIPGLVTHIFEEIAAPNSGLADIANAFLFFPEFSGCKAFWIKKLKCKHSQATGAIHQGNTSSFVNLNDVIIMRNMFNSDTLKRCSPYKQTPMDTCMYLTSDKNKSYKVTWHGPEINLENININPVYSSDYKRDLIAYCPNLKQHIQKTNTLV